MAPLDFQSLHAKYVIEMSRVFNKHGMTLLNQGKHIECQKLFDQIFMTLKKQQKSSEEGQD